MEIRKTTNGEKNMDKGNKHTLGKWTNGTTIEDTMEISQKFENRLSYDSVILLLGTYTNKTKSAHERIICTPMYMQSNSR